MRWVAPPSLLQHHHVILMPVQVDFSAWLERKVLDTVIEDDSVYRSTVEIEEELSLGAPEEDAPELRLQCTSGTYRDFLRPQSKLQFLTRSCHRARNSHGDAAQVDNGR